MPEGIALHVTAEVAHALAYIHDLRDDDNRALAIVHRDVSPPNILLSWNGDVKLSDFGIALSRPADDGDRAENGRAAPGGVQGKLHYMPPEQARGEPVGAAADVYALGATLDALLGGGAHAPVTSEESGNAREASARLRGLSLPVCALIHSCLARDARFRPSAADVAARAGVLASQMLGTDGRGALRAWLEPIRARMGQIGALDDLMGLCLVPVPGGGAGARTFTISRVAQTPGARTHRRRDGGKNSWRPLIAAGMLTVAFAATVFAWRTVRRSNAETISSGDRSTERLAAPRSVAAPAGPGTPAGAGTSVGGGAGSSIGRFGGAATSADAEKRGWVRVGGEALVGARVETDGMFAGYAPLEMSLPVGSHMIMVTSRAGHLVVHKRVHLDEAQTRLVPLRILK
jgi:serine/threonine-protein kinase